MKRIWEIFPDVSNRVKQAHEEVRLRGHHDFVHAYRVGDAAYRIADDEWSDKRISEMSGLAGLSHNADRIIQARLNNGRQEVQPEEIIKLVHTWCSDVLGESEFDIVTQAVLKHDGKNSTDDSKVLIALMDSDRVVNMAADLIMRSGQHYCNLPAVNYQHPVGDPQATYINPGSVLQDVLYALDWVDPESPVCVRTKIGRIMAEKRAKLLRLFSATAQEQLKEEGIIPYPFKD